MRLFGLCCPNAGISNNKFRVVISGLALLITVVGSYLVLHEPQRTKSGKVPGMSYAISPPLKSYGDPRLRRLPDESDFAFAKRINQVIFESFYHCAPNDAARIADKLALHLVRSTDREQGFLDPKSARCGFCHQAAFILSYALERGGVNASPIGLNGHVVSLVTTNEGSYLFDPDYGASAIPYPNYSNLQVKSIYEQAGRWRNSLVPVYASTDDDGPYYSMDSLKRTLLYQRMAVFFIESAVLLILLLAIVNFYLTLAKYFKISRYASV